MMKALLIALMLAFMGSAVYAHEMTPTYPKLEPSHIDGVLKTTMQMFNKREDVEFYEIGVFDKDFKPVPFVSSYQVVKIRYLGHVTFDIYIRGTDRDKAVYICSRSKLRKEDISRTAISSRICSKIK
jgi:hypothetical protein